MDLKYTKDKKKLLKTFKNGFSSFLARKGYKTQDVAKILCVTDSAVSSWKYGRAFPDVLNLYKLIEMGFSFLEMTQDNRPLSIIADINEKEAGIDRFEKLILSYEKALDIEDSATNEFVSLQKEIISKKIEDLKKGIEANKKILKKEKITREELKYT